MFEGTQMNYAEVNCFDVDETAPLIYMIHIDHGKTRDLYVGSAVRGSDLPRRGQLWTAQSLLQSDPPFPDWFYRCRRVHFAMAEAWLQNQPITLALIANCTLSGIASDRNLLETTMRAQLNADLPVEVGPFLVRLRMLRFKALDEFTHAQDPRTLKLNVPQLWEAACEGYADMHAISVREAQRHLSRKFAI